MEKKITNFRLTLEAIALLAATAKHYGISRTALMEVMIREKAESAGITAKR